MITWMHTFSPAKSWILGLQEYRKMLEVCPSVADGPIGIKVCPLSMGDWAAAMGIEAVYIDRDTNIRNFKRELQLGSLFYR